MIANFALYATKAILILIVATLISYSAVFYHAPEQNYHIPIADVTAASVPMKRYHLKNAWRKMPSPILTASLPWEEHDVSEPNLWKSGHKWHMIYTGGWSHGIHLGYATSPDGIHWNKHREPIIAHGAESSIYREYGTLYVYYSPTINTSVANGGDLLVSSGPDALHLKPHKIPAMVYSKEAIGITNTCLMKKGTQYILHFDSNCVGIAHWKQGIAISNSPLGPFHILVFPLKSIERGTQGGYGAPNITKQGQTYTLWYLAALKGTLPTDIYSATSTDLIHWQKAPMQITRETPYEFDQVADPFVINSANQTRMYYSAMNNTKSTGMICMAFRHRIPLN